MHLSPLNNTLAMADSKLVTFQNNVTVQGHIFKQTGINPEPF